MKSHNRPLNRSITIGCVAFIIVLCILLSLANPVLYQNYVFQDYRDYISDLLLYKLDHIDGDDLKACIETGKESEKYKESLLFMDDLMDTFNKELESLSADPSLEPWEKVSAAIGAAFYDPAVDKNIDSLLWRADAVMYERKKEMKAARED